MRLFTIISLLSLLGISKSVAQEAMLVVEPEPGSSLTVNIVGPSSATAGQILSYSVEFRDQNGYLVSPPTGTGTWYVYGGYTDVISNLSCQIEWTTPGTGTIDFEYETFDNYYYDSHIVNVTGVPVPNTTFNFTYNCGNTIVQRQTNPTSQYDWWWQTSSTGTSTSLGNSPSITRTTSGSLYLRARTKTTPYTWSYTSQFVGNITVYTSAPAQPVANQSCRYGQGQLTLSVQPSTGATSYKWYSVPSGGTAISGYSTTSIVVETDKTVTYYVSALAGGCESSRVAVTGTVYSPPEITSTSNGVLVSGGTVQLTTVNTHDSYTWYNKNNQIVGTTRTITVSTTSQYRVQATNCGGSISAYSVPYEVWLQSTGPDMNYVATNKLQVEGITDPTAVKNLSNSQVERVTQYFDGLGRPLQSVSKQGSPDGNDIVVPFTYNKFGKPFREYLPVSITQTTGIYRQGILDWAGNYSTDFYNQPGSEIASDSRPFSEIQYESTPLFRATNSFSPGQEWYNGNFSVRNEYHVNKYGTNAGEEKIIIWKITEQSNLLPLIEQDVSTSNGYYGTGQLLISITFDEHGNDTKEYVDKLGRVIAKKTLLTSAPTKVYAETNFIYDDGGNLRVVLSPEAVSRISTDYLPSGSDKEAFLRKWAFRYNYDERKRLIEKQAPGTEAVYSIYDKRNRLIMSQDGVQRPLRQWTFTKYDNVNRPIITGLYTHGSVISRASMSALISTTNYFETYNGNAATHGYTNNLFPTTNVQVLAVTYYDNYNFKSLVGTTLNYVNTELSGQPPLEFNRLLGQVTGIKTNILGTTNYQWTVNYYDDKYRIIQTIAQNHKDGIDRTTNLYDFVRLTNSKITHSNSSASYIISRRFSYDHAGRLLRTYHSVNGAAEIILSENEYNELGQLVVKKLHSEDNGSTFKQHVDMRYNIRGWLTRINNADLMPDDPNEPRDHFGMNLAYNDVMTGINNTPQFNGNISATKYSANQGFDSELTERAYKYQYDAMSRLTASTHFEKSGAWSTSTALHEDNITYDLNTSILTMSRKGEDGSQMDNLAFDYGTGAERSNLLMKVTDSWDKTKGFVDGTNTDNDYIYDSNGNRLVDKNRGITTSITYNHLNLPEKIVMPGGSYLLNNYDASGTKLSQDVYNSSNILQKKTDYVGEFLYENDTLKYISNEEGRYNMLASAYEYELRDHLSNNRVTFTTKEEQDAATATVETENLTAEQTKFLRYDNARRISSHLFDKTNGNAPSTAPGYAVRLNGSANEKMGLARSFAVVPGDTVKAEVFVKYVDTNSSNWTSALNTLLTQITNGTASPGTVVDGGSYSSSTSSFPFAGLLNTSGSSGTGPKAYLNWLIFDQNFTFINGGYVRMSDAAREYGQDCVHEKLSAEFAITKPGFVYVYLSNENETLVEVYYDQFEVALKKSPVINSTDLYPYGAPALSYTREFSLKQDKLMNGKEWIDELGYGKFALGQREFDPFVPVFSTQDRFAEKYHWMSPYQYAAGNPVKFVDVNGDSLWIKSGDGNLLYQNGKLYSRGEDGFTEYKGELAKFDKEGNVKGYRGILGQTVNALNKLSEKSAFADHLISTVSGSQYNYFLKPSYTGGNNAPVETGLPAGKPQYGGLNNNAYYYQVLDQGFLNTDYSPFNNIGSGGEINWNPKSGIIGLGHELGHSYDEHFGMMDSRTVELVNGRTAEIREIRATYYENRIRQDLGKPLRKFYNDSWSKMVSSTGQPIFYPTPYTHR